MALVKCEDCDKEVSTRAAACPNCGVPLSAQQGDVRADGSYVTTQGTAKSLKEQQLLAALVLAIGLVMTFSASEDSSLSGFGALLTVGGLLWYLGARISPRWRQVSDPLIASNIT